ncbi:MAG: hypothetical protein ABFS34_04745 [Gemmatimonadota bacterium]
MGGRTAVALLAAWLAASCAPAGVARAPGDAAPADPAATQAAAHANGPLFRTSDACIACHNRVVGPAGEDVSIGSDWRASMMANSARDPYWHAAVRREIMEHPDARAAIEDKCATCHMPMARYSAHTEGGSGSVFENLPVGAAPGARAILAADGVSCSVCHQISPEGLGDPSSFSGGFTIGAAPGGAVFGPFGVDAGRRRIMASATGLQPDSSAHIQSSELCGSCHTLHTHPLAGDEAGEFPEQMPYQEWLHSDYAGERSCQSCHMPEVEGEVAVTGVLGRPRAGVNRHAFRGGNFFMLRMLNRYRDELGVQAPSPELEAAARRTVEHLQTRTARLEIRALERSGGRLRFDVAVENLAGHKLPSAYPSRRAWLHVTVTDEAGAVLFESGRFRPDGSIEGNDSDEDATRYERHHRTIERADQVQIYEAIMEHGDGGGPTTGLLNAVAYLKDNRLLPRGFEPVTAHPDVAVLGAAAADQDFHGGSDVVSFDLAIDGAAGPMDVAVALRYQPIAYRWALNLADFPAFETDRFVRYYQSMASGSSLVVAEVEGRVE